MLKRLLIISPYFPPVNAADMQRVRTSLPYFKKYGWEAEVVTIDLKYVDIITDNLLSELIPGDIQLHYVKAFDKQLTSKLGLGSIALRSLWFYKQKVNQLLAEKKFDLIYFSTTQFPVCILGAYWKKLFKIPYVVDIQDPWHSNYYKDKPKHQRPPKYWFAYRLNKYLEPIAVINADGLISVSPNYIDTLKERYPAIKHIPARVVTFGAFKPDVKLALAHEGDFERLLDANAVNLVYIGRGGADMHQAIKPLFKALQNGLVSEYATFSKLKLYFIGTSYAAPGQGKQTISTLAKLYNIDDRVIEITDRISYYQTLVTLQQADSLFIPGSDDPAYSASKIYPYLNTGKPVLAILHPDSPAKNILSEFNASYVYSYDDVALADKATSFLIGTINNTLGKQNYNAQAIHQYDADTITGQQCDFFEQVLNKSSF